MALEDEDFDLLTGGEDDAAAEDTDDSAGSTALEGEDEAGVSDTGTDEEAGAGVSGPGTVAAGEEDGGSADASGAAGAAPEPQSGQQVPLAVLLDERKGFQSRIDQLSEKAAKADAFMDRMEDINRRKAEEAAKPEEPEYLDDPKGYIDHKTGEAKQAATESKENITQLREMSEAQAQIQQTVNRLQSYDTEFIKAGNEDLYDAIEHVRSVNVQNGLDMGLNQQQAEQEAAKAMFMTQAQVLNRNKNPSEYIYNLAKRWGYSKAVAEPAKPTEDADDIIAAGQDAQSMGGGAAPGEDQHDEELDDEEFTEIFTEMFGQKPR